jgi:hypothetical protein
MSVAILQKAQQRFYHSTNLQDFLIYWNSRGVLSRDRLEKTFPEFTKFFTDEKDKSLGVWDRSFGNLYDFGSYFWSYERSTPNLYGPITLVYSPRVWHSLSDIRITKNTIVAEDPGSISPENWGDIYEEVNGVQRIKKGYTSCEVSVANGIIPFTHLAFILVDPIRVGKLSVRDYLLSAISVDDSTFKLTEKRLIERRISCVAQEERMADLIKWSQNLKGSLITKNRPLDESLPSVLAEWFNALEDWKKRILASWLTYTYNGTVRILENKMPG